MIIPDVNLLLFATVEGVPPHAKARAWWEDVLDGPTEIGIPGVALFGFIRIVTNPRIFKPAMAAHVAVATTEGWLRERNVRFLQPGPRHLEVAFGLLRGLGTAGNLTTDVQLAALAIEYQAELCSADNDFARFPGLRWRNPVAAPRTSRPR